MTDSNTARATAERIIHAALAKGFHGQVLQQDGHPATPFTGDFETLAGALEVDDMETLVLAAPPVRPGDKYAYRGSIQFTWGRGADPVTNFTDNLYVRQIVGVLADA